MKVYIARHGQVLHNLLEQYNTNNEDLTPLGITQAEELKEKIKEYNFDIVISSPLLSCLLYTSPSPRDTR